MGDAPEREGRSQAGAGGTRAPSDASVASRELRSAPRPLDRSIYWVPRKLQLAGRTVPTSTDLFVSARVLRQVKGHLAAGSGSEVGGLLAGDLFRCPDSGRIWVRVESALRVPGPLPEQAAVEELEKSFDAVQKRAPGETARWLGWYHSHALLGVFLSERDARFHLKSFPESWQIALVVLADPERPGGGVFQPTARGSVVRSLYLPFWELREAAESPGEGARPTAMNWENYTTTGQVVPERPGRDADASSRADVDGAEEEPAEEPDGGPTAGAPAEADGGFAAGAPAEAGRGPTAGAPAGADGGFAAGAPMPPGARGPMRRPPARVDRPGTGMRLGPSPGEEYPLEVPLVLPGNDGAGIAEVWRQHRGLAAALLFLCLLAGGWLVWDRVVEPRLADEVAADEPGTQPAATRRPATAEFQEAVQDFQGSVEAYMERRTDFDLGRLGCEGLTLGYRAVDEAFLRVSELFVALRDGRGPRPTDRYEEAAQRMEQVDRHFDASGCPRPS